MKKVLSVTALFILVFSLALLSFAQENGHQYIDVLFNENSSFSEFQKSCVIDKFNGVTEVISENTDNIICTILGHDYTTENVHVRHHLVYSVDPTCEYAEYRVSVCSRCGDSTETLLNTTRIHCH